MYKNNLAKIKAREIRLPFVEQLLLRGYSDRYIRTEVLATGLQKTYSLATVHSDVKLIKAAWAAEQRADREEVLQSQIKAAQDRNVELWKLYKETKNPACLAEIRHNEEHIADLLQLGKQDKTNIYNHTSNYVVSSQQIVNIMAEMKKRGG